MKSFLRTIAATSLFAAIHSALASRVAKKSAEQVFGQRNRNGLYRAVYIGQSIGTFALLTAYIRRQPGSVLYEIPMPVSGAMRATQLAGFLVAAQAASKVGITKISGAKSFGQWLGEGKVEPEPEAQGPALVRGKMDQGGPFRFSRHPLNFWPLLVLWFSPRMTTNLLAFNAAATVYLVIGSAHEEVRLRQAYGQPYEQYEAKNIPFYVPRFAKRITGNG
jgi:hypothetical protein